MIIATNKLHYLNNMSLFKPKDIINRFNYFDAKKYRGRGFKAVFIDIDNTIAVPDTGKLSLEAKMFLDDIKKERMIPVIFSNNNKKRVSSFISGYNIHWTFWSLKPLPFMYWYMCMKLSLKPSEVIVIGDQLLTDILGANLSGCYGIYCKQLTSIDVPVTARNRRIERLIWRYILHEKV